MRKQLWAPVFLMLFASLFAVVATLNAQNSQPSLDELRKRAESGNAAAQVEVGKAYQFGRGTAKDYTEAVRWYSKSAEQGNAVGQLYLGIMYAFGNGVPKNDTEAVRWYRKSAEQGNADAQICLGEMYANGRGAAKDDAEAVRWYRKAAEQGDASGQTILAWMYEVGRGVTQDYAEAARWYRKAAEQGDSTAQSNLGNFYDQGKGVRQDFQEAVRWYRKAAAQGYGYALYNLGTAYESGRGVEIDKSAAAYWYGKAVDKGIEQAKTSLANLGSVTPRAPSDNAAGAVAQRQTSMADASSAPVAKETASGGQASSGVMGCAQYKANNSSVWKLCRLGEFVYLEEALGLTHPVLTGGEFQRSADGRRIVATFGAVRVTSELVETKLPPEKFLAQWLDSMKVVKRRIQNLNSDDGLKIQEAFVEEVPAVKLHFVTEEKNTDYLNYAVLMPVKDMTLIVTFETPFQFSKRTLDAEYAALHTSIANLYNTEAAIERKAEEWDRDEQHAARNAMNAALWQNDRKAYDKAMNDLQSLISAKKEEARRSKEPVGEALFSERTRLGELEMKEELDTIDTFSRVFAFEYRIRISDSFRNRAQKEASPELLARLMKDPKGTFIDRSVRVRYPVLYDDVQVLHRIDDNSGDSTLTFHKRGGWLKIVRTTSGQYSNSCMNPNHKICKLESKGYATFGGERVTKRTYSTHGTISKFKDTTVLQTERPSGINHTIIYYWNSKIKDHWDPASIVDSITFLGDN